MQEKLGITSTLVGLFIMLICASMSDWDTASMRTLGLLYIISVVFIIAGSYLLFKKDGKK